MTAPKERSGSKTFAEEVEDVDQAFRKLCRDLEQSAAADLARLRRWGSNVIGWLRIFGSLRP